MNADRSGNAVILMQKKLQNPDWSPNGKKIVCENWNSDEIFTMNADGTGVINLTNKTASDTEPSW